MMMLMLIWGSDGAYESSTVDDEDGSPDRLEPPAVCEDVRQPVEWPAGLLVHPVAKIFIKLCTKETQFKASFHCFDYL